MAMLQTSQATWDLKAITNECQRLPTRLEVLAPANLRKRIKDELTKVLESYWARFTTQSL